jgi:hypothetical protein
MRILFPVALFALGTIVNGCAAPITADEEATLGRQQQAIGTYDCSASLAPYVNNGGDDTAALQGCLNGSSPGDTVLLPAGVFDLSGTVFVPHAMTLQTKNGWACAPTAYGHCAALRANPGHFSQYGLLKTGVGGNRVNGVTLKWLVIDGNKNARRGSGAYNQCRTGTRSFGVNVLLHGEYNAFVQSVSMSSLCYTGVEASNGAPGTLHNLDVNNSYFMNNGWHASTEALWADGLTVHDCAGCNVSNNAFGNNTDVQLIFGGCQGCEINTNHLWHDDPAHHSFAALMLQRWPGGATSGNYSNTRVRYNDIQCNYECGMGILLGSRPWYDAPCTADANTFITNNTIVYAQQPMVFEDWTGGNVYSNGINNLSPGIQNQTGGYDLKAVFQISSRAAAINLGGENVAHPEWFSARDWPMGGVPNYIAEPQMRFGYTLQTSQPLYSGAWSYALFAQTDCNLVSYTQPGWQPVWATNTGGRGSNCRLAMQHDGNLVMYTPSNQVIWASNTSGSGQAARLSSSGRLQILNAKGAVVRQF